MNLPKILILPSLLIIASQLHGIVRLDTTFGVTDTDYINEGNAFPAAVMAANSSGVVVAQRWVLTAAHLGTGFSTVTVNGTPYSISDRIVHPDYSSSDLTADLQLVEVSSPITGVTPLSVIGQGDTSYLGQEVTILGYGKSGTGLVGDNEVSGTKRGGSNTVDVLTDNATFQIFNPSINETSLVMDFDDGTTTENTLSAYGSTETATSLEGQLALHDSGGPVLYESTPGNFVVVGIHSQIFNVGTRSTGEYGNLSASTRMDLYSDWVANAIPEPNASSLFLGAFSLAYLLLAARRRRQ